MTIDYKKGDKIVIFITKHTMKSSLAYRNFEASNFV